MLEADMVDLSSSNTEEMLELLSLSPACGYYSPLSKLRTSSESDLFEDWPEANDMAASVYDALTADASSSHASSVDSLHSSQKSCVGVSSARRSRSRAASSTNPQQNKTTLTNTPQRKSKKTKIDVEHALAAPTLRGGSLSTADFDKSKWEIMYPLFVNEGPVIPSKCVNRKDA
jgi:hypothetical protein